MEDKKTRNPKNGDVKDPKAKNVIRLLCACLSVQHEAEGKQIAIFEPASERGAPQIKGLFQVVTYVDEEAGEVGFEAQKGYQLTLKPYDEPTEDDGQPHDVKTAKAANAPKKEKDAKGETPKAEQAQTGTAAPDAITSVPAPAAVELPKKVKALVDAAELATEEARKARETADKAEADVVTLKQEANAAAGLNEKTSSKENAEALEVAIGAANKMIEEAAALVETAGNLENLAKEASDAAKEALDALEVK